MVFLDQDCVKQADPVMLEVFNNLFVSAAEQMGYALQNTARSVNIKERLDFSCAIFDAQGHLIANAPHIPVHLGSMDRSVETILREVGDNLEPGDVWFLNLPEVGGNHLPDVKAIRPIYAEGEIVAFAASLAHWADIGGAMPGSYVAGATDACAWAPPCGAEQSHPPARRPRSALPERARGSCADRPK